MGSDWTQLLPHPNIWPGLGSGWVGLSLGLHEGSRRAGGSSCPQLPPSADGIQSTVPSLSVQTPLLLSPPEAPLKACGQS